MRAVFRQAVNTAARVSQLAIVGVIRGYQIALSPLLGPRCKYYPSCSHYGLEAVRRHGAMRGSALAAWRVARCNPWSHGGVDDVPLAGEKLFRRTRNNAAALQQSPTPTAVTPTS